MHRYSNNVGCASVEPICFHKDVKLSSFTIEKQVNYECFRLSDELNVSAFSLAEKKSLEMFMLTEQAIITAYLICTINKESYLKVNPDYVWLTPDVLSSGEFDIISNVKWNIV